MEEFLKKLAGAGKTRAEAEHEFCRDARPASLLQRFITPEEIANMVAWCAAFNRNYELKIMNYLGSP